MSQHSTGVQWCLFVAWCIALLAMSVSLYGSEVLHLSVCHLCWYQRICLYPLVLVLGVAVFRGDAAVVPYAIGLPIVGGVFALYQYLEQMIPGFAPIKMCVAGGDCSEIHFQWLGFITYPLLSLFACVAIIILLLMVRHCGKQPGLSWS